MLTLSRSETAVKAVPQRLKAGYTRIIYGTAEPVPFVQGVFQQPVKTVYENFTDREVSREGKPCLPGYTLATL